MTNRALGASFGNRSQIESSSDESSCSSATYEYLQLQEQECKLLEPFYKGIARIYKSQLEPKNLHHLPAFEFGRPLNFRVLGNKAEARRSKNKKKKKRARSEPPPSHGEPPKEHQFSEKNVGYACSPKEQAWLDANPSPLRLELSR